jgi:polysaccharide biosynthesis/export protein
MKKKLIFPILFLALVLLVFTNSCKILRPTEMFIVDDDYPISNFEPSKKEYVIQPYDKISIKIVSNDGESFFGIGSGGTSSSQRNQSGMEFPVEFDGLVKVPILGRIPIINLTIREAEQMLEEKYGEYFVDPFVLISVTNRTVLIFKNSGTSALTLTLDNDKFSLIDAIARTGGLTDISKSYSIKLIRGDLTDNPKVYYWNIRTLNDLEGTNLLLEANDIIYINSKPQYLNRVLRDISPYLTLTTTIVSMYLLFSRL